MTSCRAASMPIWCHPRRRLTSRPMGRFRSQSPKSADGPIWSFRDRLKWTDLSIGNRRIAVIKYVMIWWPALKCLHALRQGHPSSPACRVMIKIGWPTIACNYESGTPSAVEICSIDSAFGSVVIAQHLKGGHPVDGHTSFFTGNHTHDATTHSDNEPPSVDGHLPPQCWYRSVQTRSAGRTRSDPVWIPQRVVPLTRVRSSVLAGAGSSQRVVPLTRVLLLA